jgi:hypothetical protein
VLRLAFSSLPADLRGEANCPRNEAGSPQVSSRASLENSPVVAWHSGRQNSTGRETSFWAIAYTGRLDDAVFGGEATSKPAPFADGAKGCGTRKIKSRTKTSQLQDELPEWVHHKRGVVNGGDTLAKRWANRPYLIGRRCSPSCKLPKKC